MTWALQEQAEAILMLLVVVHEHVPAVALTEYPEQYFSLRICACIQSFSEGAQH